MIEPNTNVKARNRMRS